MMSQGRLLIMDDDDDILLLAQRALAKLGYESTAAKDGVHALTLYQKALEDQSPFAAVIADLSIPGGMGGRELAERLREIDPGAKVVVSSGHTHDPAMLDFAAHGFCGQIAKPYRLSELSSLLDRILPPDKGGV
jgi:two-component system cell cycle sensor histidine kinase/response regulator CckA